MYADLSVPFNLNLSHDVAVIQWITSCHKNRMTTRVTRSILKKDKRRSDPWDFLLFINRRGSVMFFTEGEVLNLTPHTHTHKASRKNSDPL